MNLTPDSALTPNDPGAEALKKIKIVTEIRNTVQDVRDLPTLPTIAMQAMRITSDKNATINDLVQVIEVDVALTGKILRTANSAYYGVPRKIDSLKMALVVIGMDEIANLVTTASVLKLFPQKPGGVQFDMNRFWFHSAAVAEICLGLYDALKLPKPGATYVAGLMHDLGRLILHQYFNSYHAEIEEKVAQTNTRRHQVEMDLIGVDHGHIGGWLIQRWNLPEEIINGVSQHHIRPADAAPYSLPVMIDHADQMFYLMENSSQETVIAFLRDSKDWQEWMNARGGPAPTIVADLFKRIERANTLLGSLS